MKRKIVSILLAAIIVLGLLPSLALAQGYPDAEAWALGCCAIIAERNELDPYEFGMPLKGAEIGTTSFLYVQLLSRDWNINSRDDLIGTIERMTDNGHNVEFAELYKRAAAVTEKELEILVMLGDDFMLRHSLTKLFGDKWGDKQIKAWDWFRMIHLASWGFSAGYLEREEAYDLMIPIIERLRATFSSWDEATDNYMDGYAWWSYTDVSEPDTEYQLRLQLYEELKARSPEHNLFDPAVWDDSE